MLSGIFNYYFMNSVSALELLYCPVSGNIWSHYNRVMEDESRQHHCSQQTHLLSTLSFVHKDNTNSVATMSVKATRTSQLVPPCCEIHREKRRVTGFIVRDKEDSPNQWRTGSAQLHVSSWHVEAAFTGTHVHQRPNLWFLQQHPPKILVKWSAQPSMRSAHTKLSLSVLKGQSPASACKHPRVGAHLSVCKAFI